MWERVTGDIDDGVVEVAQPRQRGRHVGVAPGPQQGHLGANAGHAEHRHQERRLVLAVAVAPGERLPRGPRHDRSLAKLHARIADLAPQQGQQPLDDLGSIGLLADRLLDQRADRFDVQMRFDQLGVGRGHVVPRLAGREDDLRQLGVFGGQIIFGRRRRRQRAEVEDQGGASLFFRAGRFGIAGDDFMFQRQPVGGVDHQAKLAHRILLGQHEAFHDAVVEQRADLVGFDFLFDDRAYDDRRQRPAEQFLVAEDVRRILFRRGLADALLVQGVGLSVGRDHADAEDRLLFAPRRPVGLGA